MHKYLRESIVFLQPVVSRLNLHIPSPFYPVTWLSVASGIASILSLASSLPPPSPQVLYSWMESLRYSPEDYCIATRLPKQLLLDTHKTLRDCGLVSDTTLVVEERE